MCGKRITEIIRGKRKALKSNDFKAFFRGDGGIRTHDLYTASVALSQLSYAPMGFSDDLNYHTRKPPDIQHLFLYFFIRRYKCRLKPPEEQPEERLQDSNFQASMKRSGH